MSVFRVRLLPNNNAVVYGRFIDAAKNLYQRADLASITYRVVKQDDGAEIVQTTALNVATVLTDTPFAWDGSLKAANFRHMIETSVFTLPATTYEIQYTYTANDGIVGGGSAIVETEDPA